MTEASATPDRPVIIVGSGIGGVRTAQRLRARGFEGSITVLGAEPHRAYNRPPLSKGVLAGDELSALLTKEVEAALAVDWRPGVTARAVDTNRRVVATTSREFHYGRLVIATGAVPRRVPGLPGVVLRTWDDALALRAHFAPGRTVAVIGAGVLGCEIAASAVAAGCAAHLIDVETAPMTRVLGQVMADEVAELHEANGVHLHLGTSVTVDNAGALAVSDGVRLVADVVVQAVGAAPDVDWLAGSGLAIDNGVTCDERGRASADGVYAVGDVASWQGRRHEHWTSATDQADVVAADICGLDLPARAVAYWWSDQHGVKLQGLGDTSSGEVWLGTTGPQSRRVALYARGESLVGVVGFSAAGAVMKLRASIQQGVAVAEVAAGFAAAPAHVSAFRTSAAPAPARGR